MAKASEAKRLEIARRRERVEELAASGLRSSYKIADALNAAGVACTYKTVQRDIQAIEVAAKERYGSRRLEDKLWKVREAEQRNVDLRSRVAELDAEWQRSKQDKTRKRKKTVTPEGRGAKATGRTETQGEVEGRLGEVAYLAEVRMICAEIRKNDELIARLLGLEEPKKVAPTTPDGEKPYQMLSDEQLQAIITGSAAGGRRDPAPAGGPEEPV